MSFFRKKPVIIEAIQWDGTNVADIRELFDEFLDWHLDICKFLVIKTLEGNHTANPNDWIIKGIKDAIASFKPDIFEKTYEEVGVEQ